MTNEEILMEKAAIKVVPGKSSERYRIVHKEFMEWRALKRMESFSEDVLLSFFEEQSQKFSGSSLWWKYSILRSTLLINQNVNIESYSELREFLREKKENHVAKKTNTFTAEQFKTFITEAPDNDHLLTKVIMIMGVMGALKKKELYNMDIEDVQDLGMALLVTVPTSSEKDQRNFTVINEYYETCKKYIDLRPHNCPTSAFFLNYQKGRCAVTRIGINKFSDMGRLVAEYLNLPDSKSYFGCCFKRSSAFMIDSEGDSAPVSLPPGWEFWKNSSRKATNKSTNENGIRMGRNVDENSRSFSVKCEYSDDSNDEMEAENKNLDALLNVTPEIKTISLSAGESGKAKKFEAKKKKSKQKSSPCKCIKLKNEFQRRQDEQRRQNKFLRRKLVLMEERVEALEKLAKSITENQKQN